MSKRPFVKIDNAGNVLDLPLDAASLDGHQMEQTGIESNTSTIPTTAQVKEFVNKNITSEGTTKSAVAYQDNVSANACPYALLNKVGGMSYKVLDNDTNEYVIQNTAITSVISKDSNDTALQIISIPNEIQALEGYGWGIDDTCYNYIDFENKKFIQKVGRVDLGTLSWNYTSADDLSRFYIGLTDAKAPINNNQLGNVLLANYENTDWNTFTNATYGKDMTITLRSDSVFFARNLAYTSASDFKTAMSGVYLYYELETPIETDISQYIDDNSIQIEANGTITFTNTYNQAIPYEYLYNIGVIPIVDEKLTNYLSKAKITLSGTTLTIDLD